MVDQCRAPSALVGVRLDCLEPEEAAHWRRELERTARPCGCKSGAALSLVALAGWPAWIFASGLPDTPVGLVLIFVGYAFVVIGAGILGKLAGIAAGRHRHRRLRRHLTQRLAVLAPSDGR